MSVTDLSPRIRSIDDQQAEIDEVLIPPGRYEVSFVSEKKFRWFGRLVWLCKFRIVDGPHSGAELPIWFNIPPKNEFIHRSHALARAYVVATGMRPPKRLHWHPPSWFLQGCTFSAEIRTVRRDTNGIERPEEASYSRVDYLIQRLSGCPKCQRLNSPTGTNIISGQCSSKSKSKSESKSKSKSKSKSQSGSHRNEPEKSNTWNVDHSDALADKRARTNKERKAQVEGGSASDALPPSISSHGDDSS